MEEERHASSNSSSNSEELKQNFQHNSAMPQTLNSYGHPSFSPAVFAFEFEEKFTNLSKVFVINVIYNVSCKFS